jgi:hypothetical protein
LNVVLLEKNWLFQGKKHADVVLISVHVFVKKKKAKQPCDVGRFYLVHGPGLQQGEVAEVKVNGDELPAAVSDPEKTVVAAKVETNTSRANS